MIQIKIFCLLIFLYLIYQRIVLGNKMNRLEYEFEKIKINCDSYERRLNFLLHDKAITDDEIDGDMIKEILKKQIDDGNKHENL